MAQQRRPRNPDGPKSARPIITQWRNRIGELRSKRGLSMAQLAALANTTPPTVSRLEKGQMKLTMDYITNFARALECDPIELIPLSASTTLIPRIRARLAELSADPSFPPDRLAALKAQFYSDSAKASDVGNIDELAEALGVTALWLLGGGDMERDASPQPMAIDRAKLAIALRMADGLIGANKVADEVMRWEAQAELCCRIYNLLEELQSSGTPVESLDDKALSLIESSIRSMLAK